MSFATLILSSGCVSDLYLRFVFSHYQCIVLDFSSALLAIEVERRSHMHTTRWELSENIPSTWIASRDDFMEREKLPRLLPSCLSLYKKSNLISSDVWNFLSARERKTLLDMARLLFSRRLSLLLVSFLSSWVLSLDRTRKFIFYTRPLNTRCWWWHILHGGAFCEYKKFTHGEKVSITASEDEKGRKKREETKKSNCCCCCWRDRRIVFFLNVVEHKKGATSFGCSGGITCVWEREWNGQ